MCNNCNVECVNTLCPACTYLLTGPVEYVGRRRRNGETEKFVNRRWQMRFNRGDLDPQVDTSVLWVQKFYQQDW